MSNDDEVWYCRICDRTRIEDKKAIQNHRRTCGFFSEEISDNSLRAPFRDAHDKAIKKLPRDQGKALIKPEIKKELSNYRVGDETIAERAPRLQISRNTVTEFSSKVFALYNNSSQSAQAEGKKQEITMDNVRRGLPIADVPNYKLLYKDKGKESKIYSISNLHVNARPLRGKPDLIFLNTQKNEVLIVERKFTRAEIPKNGWPNVRAQLWAYAQIDDLKKYNKIHLRAEVWDSASLRNRQNPHQYKKPNSPVVFSFDFSDLDPIWLPIFERMGGQWNN
jgi:hypothetical protein